MPPYLIPTTYPAYLVYWLFSTKLGLTLVVSPVQPMYVYPISMRTSCINSISHQMTGAFYLNDWGHLSALLLVTNSTSNFVRSISHSKMRLRVKQIYMNNLQKINLGAINTMDRQNGAQLAQTREWIQMVSRRSSIYRYFMFSRTS